MIRKPITANGSVPELRRALTLKQIEEFASKARWEVRQEDMRANRSRCMDGRYKPGAGVIAMPGADAGLLAIGLVAAQRIAKRFGETIPDQELCEIVFGAIGGRNNFSYHTDRMSFAGDQNRFDGCSYCRLLTDRPRLFKPYTLEERQLAILQAMLNVLEAEHVKPDILRGGHDECAVLVVQNVRSLSNYDAIAPDELRRLKKLWVLDNYAVLRGLGRKRAFVFQRDLAQARIDAVASGLAQTLRPSLEASDEVRALVEDIAAVHFRRALEQLASDLPFYNIFIDAKTGDIGEAERIRSIF
jgi:hypothetical protein